MKIYIYDKDTKEFLYSKDAQINPVNKGEYIYPVNSTTILPPEFGANQTVVFNDVYWEIVPDYRGLIQINLESKSLSSVKNIGELENGYMLYSDYILTPSYKEELAQKEKQEKRNEILAQISQIDGKRIRAVCEPSVKNDDTGETWLEYYNSQIFELRKKLLEVENDA